MRALPLSVAILVFSACGDDDAPADAAADAAEDVVADRGADPSDTEVDEGSPDMFVDEPAPACLELPAVSPPACGSGPIARVSLVPGPADTGFDAELANKAFDYDRAFHAIFALHTGVNTEVRVANEADRETIRAFYEDSESWSLADFAERPVADMVAWAKVAGAYAGAGAAADAFRYAVLRDEGAPCDDVERARANMRRGLEGVRRAWAITGVPGIVARGYQRNDQPGGETRELVPLRDEDGTPLPEEKNNGTWRADNSGDLPEYNWEDSCSRDMLIGWVFGAAALWEVMARDDSFTDEEREGLRSDALALARNLMEVREEGFDLEIHDADGRRTFHGTLHENALEQVYLPGVDNPLHATMALGIMAALARITADREVASYVHNELVRRRGLHAIIRDSAGIIDFGLSTNYSNYNMSFTGAWLANRYLCGEEAREAVRTGITVDLYGAEGEARHPAVIGQSFFDFTYLAARTGAQAGANGDAGALTAARARGLGTLVDYPAPPFWNRAVENCSEEEIEALRCVAIDGVTEITLPGELGRNDVLVANEPLPMQLRPPSNYYWRSDPYRVNAGGDGQSLFPGVDFRIAYWMGRYLQME